MTIATNQARKTYAGNGATVVHDTSPMVFFDADDLVVYIVAASGAETLLVNGTGYTVTGGDGSTGEVHLDLGSSPHGAVAVGSTLVIDRVLPLTQETDLVNNDRSDAEVVESALDKLTMIAQQMSADSNRVLRQPVSDVVDIEELPTKSSRANTTLAFDANGDPTAGPDASDIVAAQAYAESAEDSAVAAAASAVTAAASAAKIPDPAGAGDANKLIKVNAGGTAYELTTVSITGDVVGPASATSRAIALYSGTTGKVIKDGPALGTSGHVLLSAGAGADPAFGQIQAAGIAANTIPLSKMARVGTSGHVLTSQGAGSDPVYAALPAAGETNTGSNVGSGHGVFKDKSGVTLRFKSVSIANVVTGDLDGTRVTDASLSISSDGDNVTITLTINKTVSSE